MANPVQYLVPIDLVQNELRNAIVQVLASAPSSPLTGQIYYDSVLDTFLFRSSTAWIAPIARANHTGTQLANTISNFDTQVRTSRLDQMAAPTATVSFNGQVISNVGTPSASTDGVNKAYVDSIAQGVVTKPSAKYSTTGALPANTYNNGASGVGATLTGTSNGALANQDGQTCAAGDLILVLNEATTANNGLYTITQLGDGSHPYILTRHVDMDQSAEFNGALVAVETGTSNAGKLWMCSNVGTFVVGTTGVTFTLLNAATSYSAGNGISISAMVISAASANTANITVTSGGINLATTAVTAGAYGSATSVATFTTDAYGRLILAGSVSIAINTANINNGQVTYAKIQNVAASSVLGNPTGSAAAPSEITLGSGLKFSGTTLLTDPTVVPGKYSTTIGNGSATSFTITHNLGTQDVIIQVRLAASPFSVVYTDCAATSTTTATVAFGVAPSTNQYRVTIMG